MSSILTLLRQIPREIACCVLSYDDRYSVRNNHIYEIGRIPPTDNRYTMLRWMFRERKLHIEWYKLINGCNGDKPQLVIPITPQYHVVLCIYLTVYYSDFSEDPVMVWIREAASVNPINNTKLIYEY